MTDIDPLQNPSLENELGGLRRGEDGRVYHSDKTILIHKDGEYNEYIQNAKERRDSAQRTLWNRVGPLRYGDIEIKKHTEIWHEERKNWLKADEINIYEDGEPSIRFIVKDTDPIERITLFGSDIADLVESNMLKSKQEVNDRLEEQLGIAEPTPTQ